MLFKALVFPPSPNIASFSWKFANIFDSEENDSAQVS